MHLPTVGKAFILVPLRIIDSTICEDLEGCGSIPYRTKIGTNDQFDVIVLWLSLYFTVVVSQMKSKSDFKNVLQ